MVKINSDLIRLRYGKSKNDSPELWKRMREYVKQSALIFNGFCLENSNLLPIHVGEYLLRKARYTNRNLLVFSDY